MKTVLYIFSIIIITHLFADSNANSVQGHRQASLVSARIADAYNEHIEIVKKRSARQAPKPPGPGPAPKSTAKPAPTTTSAPRTTVQAKFCPFNPSLSCSTSNKYQTFDGTCNNLVNPLYGAMNTPYKRYIAPAYGDANNSPRSLSVSGAQLPNPRVISRSILKDQFALERRWFHLFASFGQFMVHDITSLAASSDSNGIPLSCPCTSTNPNCLNIAIPSTDTAMGSQKCIQFTRSSPSFQSVDCVNQTYREQLNQLSSFFDCSQIYGSSVAASKSLRSFSKGQLLTSAGLSSTFNYLKKSTTDQCSTDANPALKCFQAGESRTNENLGLSSVHTLFLREHNRIALQLSTLNPSWTDETLFYETRRIIQAVYQHIIYSDWIPSTIGGK
jgi:peroxidase